MKKKLFFSIGTLLLIVTAYYSTIIIIARTQTEKLVNVVLASDRMKLSLDDLSPVQKEALLKVQDPNFYAHKGVDFTKTSTGFTTISQGLVKQYYFNNYQSGIQKVKQSLIARFAFDPLTPKDTQLKLFINEAYLGQQGAKPIRGFEEAAQYYFKKPFKDISWDEYLAMLSMIRAPFSFHYHKKPAKNQERVNDIKKMLATN